MRRRILSLGLFAPLFLGGCAAWRPVAMTPELSDGAKTAVLTTLRDPASAQFGDGFSAAEKNNIEAVCGTINARNGFGGYVGTQVFAVLHDRATGRFDRLNGEDQSLFCQLAGANNFSRLPPQSILSAQGIGAATSGPRADRGRQ